MRVDRHIRWLAVVAAVGLPALAQAQGFGLNEIGTCGMSRGYAVTGSPCQDPSDIYWNPAATTQLSGITFYGGFAAIGVGGDFTQDSTGRRYEGNVPVAFPPHVFVNYRSSGRWALGVGAYVPYGLTSQWHETFPGRFEALRASLASVYIQPNIAFEIVPGKWSIGGGPVYGHSTVTLIQGLDLSQQVLPVAGNPTFGQLGIAKGTEFGRARLDGTGTAWGFNVGLYGKPSENWTFGLRYLSQLDFKYDNADAEFTQTPTGLTLSANNPLGLPAGTPIDLVLAPEFQAGGALVDQKVSTEIKHPAQFQVGLGYLGVPNTTLSLDWNYINWSSFNKLPVTFKGPASGNNRDLIEEYKNSWSIRSGIEHRFATTEMFYRNWAVRGGFSHVTTPAPDATVTPLLPDMNRNNYALGLAIPFGTKWAFEGGYVRVDTKGRRGRIDERTSTSQTAAELNSGFYRLDANIWSASLKATF